MYKKSVVLALLMVAALFGACSKAGGNLESENLRKTLFNGDETIEASMNGIAGINGTVSYYMPKDQPTNQNFRRLGVKIEKDRITADYVIMVNTSANSSEPETLIFGGKYKFIFNEKGNGRDGRDEWTAFLTWGGASNFAIAMAGSIYSSIKPEFIILE